MKLVSAKCPSCGGDINIDENSKIIRCEYCNTNIIVENNELKIQNNQNISNQSKVDSHFEGSKRKKNFKIYLIIFAAFLVISNMIAIKINWDYKNSLGFIAFLILGLLHIVLIKESRLKEKALLLANIFGLIFFFVALWFSLYVYNLLPGYVNGWVSNNITLIIDREEATLEFKDTGLKEKNKYSSYNELKYNEGKAIKYTRIKISEYYFIYFEEENTMCYSNDKDECIEELELKKQ